LAPESVPTGVDEVAEVAQLAGVLSTLAVFPFTKPVIEATEGVGGVEPKVLVVFEAVIVRTAGEMTAFPGT
jgi:hypothetical protein